MATSFTFTRTDIDNLTNQTEAVQGLRNDCNILEKHLIKMIQLTAFNNVMMSFRPISERTSYWLGEDAVGKRMDMKHKSANQGRYLSGLIPVNPHLSKLNGNSPAIINEYTKKTKFLDNQDEQYNSDKHKEFYNPKYILKKQLSTKLEPDLIDKLKRKGVNFDENQKFEVHYSGQEGSTTPGAPIPSKTGDNIDFCIKIGSYFYNEKTGEKVTTKENHAFKPVEVFAYKIHKGEEKYITADYDLMSVGGKFEKKQLELQPETTQIAKMSERIETDPELVGSCSFLSLGAATELNAQFTGQHLVTHGDEANNPFPEDFEDFKEGKGGYTFFIPKEDNGCEVVIAKNELEVIELYNRLEKEGNNISINPDWGWKKTAEGYKINPKRISVKKIHAYKEDYLKKLGPQKQKNERAQIDSYISKLKESNKAFIEGDISRGEELAGELEDIKANLPRSLRKNVIDKAEEETSPTKGLIERIEREREEREREEREREEREREEREREEREREEREREERERKEREREERERKERERIEREREEREREERERRKFQEKTVQQSQGMPKISQDVIEGLRETTQARDTSSISHTGVPAAQKIESTGMQKQ